LTRFISLEGIRSLGRPTGGALFLLRQSTAPEWHGPRNIKNKLVQLIHNVVPSHSYFYHHWKNELDHLTRFCAGSIRNDDGPCGSKDERLRSIRLLWMMSRLHT
jgi:hypothetical protein